MFNLMKHQSTRICHLHDRMSEMWDSFRIYVLSAEFTYDTGNVSQLRTYTFFQGSFFFPSDKSRKSKTSKITKTTPHQACTTSLANFRGTISRHLGRSINIQHQHKWNCISTFCASDKISTRIFRTRKEWMSEPCVGWSTLLNPFGFFNNYSRKQSEIFGKIQVKVNLSV